MCDKKDMGVLSLEEIVESDAVTDVLQSLGSYNFFSLGLNILLNINRNVLQHNSDVSE